MDLNRKMELINCNAGDIVECADGKEYEMIKQKSTNSSSEVKTLPMTSSLQSLCLITDY